MNAPHTRGAAIRAMCKACIFDKYAHGTWREQVGACTTSSCPLWGFRPLPGNAAAWLKARRPDALPAGFVTSDTDRVLSLIRSDGPDSVKHPGKCPVLALESHPSPRGLSPDSHTPAMPAMYAGMTP